MSDLPEPTYSIRQILAWNSCRVGCGYSPLKIGEHCIVIAVTDADGVLGLN